MKIYLLQSVHTQEDGTQAVIIYTEFFLLLEHAQKASLEKENPTAVLEFEFCRAWTPEQIKNDLERKDESPMS